MSLIKMKKKQRNIVISVAHIQMFALLAMRSDLLNKDKLRAVEHINTTLVQIADLKQALLDYRDMLA